MRFLDLLDETRNGGCLCCFTRLSESDDGAIMTAKDYRLQAKYDAFNQSLFDGALPKIPLRFGALKGAGGFVASKVVRRIKNPDMSPRMVKMLGKAAYGPPELVADSVRMTISSTFDRSERALDGILLHEMIHVWLICVEHDYADNHGPAFMAKLREISEKVGYPIPLTDANTSEQTLSSAAVKPVGVILFVQPDGAPIYSLVAPKVLRANIEAVIKRWTGYVPNQFALIAAYEIASPLWSEIALRSPVQRSVDYRLTRRRLGSIPAFDDLLKNGTLLGKVEPRSI